MPPPATFALLGIAAGLAAGCRQSRGRVIQAGHVGSLYVAAGIATAAVAFLVVEIHDGLLPSVLAWRLALLLGGAPAAACAYAAAVCFHSILNRSGGRAAAGARGLALACACAALVCLLASRGVVERIGTLGALMSAAWALAALGAALLVQESRRVADSGGRRRAALLGTCALLLISVSAAGQLWSGARRPDNSVAAALGGLKPNVRNTDAR
jgi:hypothetical protein